MMRQIVGVFAEYEKARLVARLKRAREVKGPYAEGSEREKAIATGRDEFDANPIEFESLVATIRRVLAKPQ
jgi:hypothetical protein